MHAIKEGFHLAKKQSFAAFTLFFFQFIWGVLFFRFIQGRIVEVMERFPPREFSGERINLYLNESLLLLQHTDIAKPVLWLLFIYIAVRVLLTPMLHAGVYNSLHDAHGPRGTIFIRGLRQFGGSFTCLYLLRMGLTAIPMYWAIPAVLRSLTVTETYWGLALTIVPWIIGISIYGSLLKMFFLYLQLALVTEAKLLRTLSFAMRRLLPICTLALTLYGAMCILTLIVYSASFHWAGLLAIVLYLAYPFIQIWFKIWAIAVQYRFWSTSI